jgi:small-conductance mechanosensitive channel
MNNKMTELSVVPITAVIVALTLAVDEYNKAKIDPASQDTAQQLLIIIIALAIFLLVALIAVLFKPTSAGARMLFSAVALIAIIVALVVAWLNYVNNSGKKFAVETLIIALAVTVPILTSLVHKDTLTLKIDL